MHRFGHRFVPRSANRSGNRFILAPLLLGAVLFARAALAQTAPPTPEATEKPAQLGVVAEHDKATASQSILPATFMEDFRSIKDRLPFGLGAGVYLFYYQPLSRKTTLAGGSPDGRTEGSLDPLFEVYAFYLKLDKEYKGFGGHAELRMRDGGHISGGSKNAYLRGFFTSNIWFQEVYAFYTPGPYLKLKGGKMYRKVGFFWDDSFFGNLQYFDGQKLNPDYGLSAEGEKDFRGGKVGLTYSLQYFVNSDGINGGLDGGRTLGSPALAPDPAARTSAARLYSPNPEGQLDSAGNRVATLRNIVDGRLALVLRPHRSFGLELAASGLTATVNRKSDKDLFDDSERMTQVAGDVAVKLGAITLTGEYLRQFGPAVRDADYGYAGVRGAFGPVALRFSASYADYHLGGGDIQELMFLPGATVTIGGGLAFLAEFNAWLRKDPRVFIDYYPYDYSMSLVLNYTY